MKTGKQLELDLNFASTKSIAFFGENYNDEYENVISFNERVSKINEDKVKTEKERFSNFVLRLTKSLPDY